MSVHSTEQLGTFRGTPYYLTISVWPSFNSVREFAVVIHYYAAADPDEEVQIARIDTSHGYTHFDRLYRRDQPKEPIDVDVWEAAALFQANWRTYARSFEERNQS